MLDPIEIKKDFPIFQERFNNKELIYLDSAATTQKPRKVIDAISEFYSKYNANIHRGVYKLSEIATQKYEDARLKVAHFINAGNDEIIFTRSTTESINLLAYSLSNSGMIEAGDEILLSELEHHSNLVPWQELCKRTGAKLKFIKIQDFAIDIDDAKAQITKKTKIVSIAHISNVFGKINNIEAIIKIAHDNGALVIIDGAQSAARIKIDVKKLDCDFFAFSGHKMMGPTGIGVLYGKKHILERMQPFNFGGDMISEVTYEKSSWNEVPWKFEAGTQNIAGAIGLACAIDYINSIGVSEIEKYEKNLTKYAFSRLKELVGITIYADAKDSDGHIGVISFNINGIHAHDVATIFDRHNIAIRGGHHCAMPLMDKLGIDSSARISLYIYNTKEDIDSAIAAIKNAKEVFKV